MKRSILISAVLFAIASISVPQVWGQKNSAPAGTVFEEKARFLIDRLEAFHREHGRYAPQEGAERFMALGLVVDDWQERSFNGIVYDPRGDRLEVRPAPEHTFFITTPKGVMRILSYNLYWSLVYNMSDGQWYFHRTVPEQLIDITTLRVKKDTPYNPDAYR